ncbi:MAG: MotA/TolQ/ExbB proton channel family protein [Armatimonadetes bacterium]|nr:MotA/TolQ/ExbB proton channel family protein [Armatimonadota bacterium]
MFDSIAALMHQGGIVMYPMLLASVVCVAVVLERLYFYMRLETGGDRFRARLLVLLREGKRREALDWLKSLRGPVPAMAAEGIEEWDDGLAAAEAAMASRARREVPHLRRYLGILDTTYSGAPLVGLLGTITGMMGTFRVVALHLSKDPQADTSGITMGIGEALTATATGISIAVVCLVFYNMFQEWQEGQMDACEAVAADILEVIAESTSRTKA